MIKSEFSASLLQSSVSHDPSEIILIYWFAAQETFLIIIKLENICADSYFWGNSFFQDLNEYKVQKNSIYFIY